MNLHIRLDCCVWRDKLAFRNPLNLFLFSNPVQQLLTIPVIIVYSRLDYRQFEQSLYKIVIQGKYRVGSDVTASESCGSSQDVESGTYRNVNQAPLTCHSIVIPLSKPKDITNDGRLIYRVALFVIARLLKAAEAILWRDMKLPCTFQVLTMTADSMMT